MSDAKTTKQLTADYTDYVVNMQRICEGVKISKPLYVMGDDGKPKLDDNGRKIPVYKMVDGKKKLQHEFSETLNFTLQYDVPFSDVLQLAEKSLVIMVQKRRDMGADDVKKLRGSTISVRDLITTKRAPKKGLVDQLAALSPEQLAEMLKLAEQKRAEG